MLIAPLFRLHKFYSPSAGGLSTRYLCSEPRYQRGSGLLPGRPGEGFLRSGSGEGLSARCGDPSEPRPGRGAIRIMRIPTDYTVHTVWAVSDPCSGAWGNSRSNRVGGPQAGFTFSPCNNRYS